MLMLLVQRPHLENHWARLQRAVNAVQPGALEVLPQGRGGMGVVLLNLHPALFRAFKWLSCLSSLLVCFCLDRITKHQSLLLPLFIFLF